MGIEQFATSTIGRFLIKVLAAGMESRFRYRFLPPARVITGADIQPGQAVLEVGCGTGYFTVPVARLIGDQGRLVAIDILSESVELVTKKVQIANLTNVSAFRRDAMDTGFDAESFGTVLLFGVIPAPMLPLNRLLPEMYRILKAEGGLAVWPPIPGWLPRSIDRSGLFTFSCRRKGVHNFRRC
jgi:ubiquinone/menaquinone biosynthesis C-methylase UbiE